MTSIKLKLGFFAHILWMAVAILSTAMGNVQATKNQSTFPDAELNELQLHLESFNIHFSNLVKHTADHIASETNDPLIYRNTLLWKMDAISFSQRLLYERPPLVNYVLTWALCKKMVFLLEEGRDKNNFGKYQPMAIATSKRLEKEIREIGSQVGDEKAVNDLAILLNDYIDKQKKNDDFYDVSLNQSVVTWIENFRKAKGYKESLLSVDKGLEVLNRQLSHYAASLPQVARWQAEYTMSEFLFRSGLQTSFKNFEAVSTELSKSAKTGEGRAQMQSALQTMAGLSDAVSKITDLWGRPEQVIDYFFKRLVQFVLFVCALFSLMYGFHILRINRK